MGGKNRSGKAGGLAKIMKKEKVIEIGVLLGIIILAVIVVVVAGNQRKNNMFLQTEKSMHYLQMTRVLGFPTRNICGEQSMMQLLRDMLIFGGI